MKKKSIPEILSLPVLEPCIIKPIPPMGEGTGPMAHRTSTEFFYKIKIQQNEVGYCLRMFHPNGVLDFQKGGLFWSIEKEGAVFIRCTFPDNNVDGKIRIFYFKEEKERNLFFQLLEKFKLSD